MENKGHGRSGDGSNWCNVPTLEELSSLLTIYARPVIDGNGTEGKPAYRKSCVYTLDFDVSHCRQ